MLKINKTGWLKKTIHLDFWVYVLFLTTNGERKYESMEKISIWVCIKQKIWLLKHIKMPRKICTLLTQKLETHHKEK